MDYIPRHSNTPARRKHRAIGAFLVGVLSFTAAFGGSAYLKLMGNVETLGNVEALVGTPSPKVTPSHSSTPSPSLPSDPAAGQPLTYLLLGSDDRSGANGDIGGQVGGMRSDTTMVVHISADRSRIQVVSIPRDSMVSIPSCTATNGATSRATFGMFNSAFATGADLGGDVTSAVACTWKTVQSLTGLTLDGAVVVDFSGFEQVVNSLGGVYMCIPERTVSPEANLYLEPGWQTLDGAQALGLARARKGEGQNFDGSDITRTGRQQQLLAAVFNQLLSKNFFSSVPQLYNFATAVTGSLTVTEELKNPSTLVGLAYSLRNIRPASISFMTIPIESYPKDRNRVQWSPEADSVWSAMVQDQPLTQEPPPSPAVSPEVSPSPELKTPSKEEFTAADTTAVC